MCTPDRIETYFKSNINFLNISISKFMLNGTLKDDNDYVIITSTWKSHEVNIDEKAIKCRVRSIFVH